MATVPLSGTNIRLLSGVPFSSDYKNSRWFDNISSQTSYFTNKPIVYSIANSNFQRIEGKHFIAINKSIDDLWNSNYLMFQNTHYNNKWFYAFVTKLEYVNQSNTRVHFQIDVLQTWKFEMNFKPSFVMREHCKLWNTDGTPVTNTVDEGLDYGSAYDIVDVQNYIPYETIYFMIIVSKEAMHTNASDEAIKDITPVLNGSPQPLSYYILPFKMDGSSPNVLIGASGLAITNVNEVLKNIYKLEPAVNNIVSIYVTEYFGYNASYNKETNVMTFDATTFEHAKIADGVAENANLIYVKQFPSYSTLTKNFGNKYDKFSNVTESKLLMYPYTQTALEDFKGSRLILKNEQIKGKDLTVNLKGSLGTSNKISYSVPDYNISDELNFSHIASLENALVNNNPNDLPIITDLLSAYLQGNRNSIENQKNTIIFNGFMNGIGSAVGALAGGIRGNAVGLASGGVNMAQGAGNAILQVQGLQAKQQDIDNVPASMTKMGGNTAYDYGNNINGLFVIKKQIKPEYRKKLSDFFNMYGYKVNEVKVPNFHTRLNWNFVQTSSCNITGDFNNENLSELKSVFDNGITLWHTDDIGNYSLANEVI